MASEDHDILDKISKLAGQINRHKNTQVAPSYRAGTHGDYTQSGSTWRPTRGVYSSRGHTRGGRVPVHRNRTLVLNGSHPSPNPDSTNTIGNDSTKTNANPTNPSWITKTDRHLQLINTSVFEKESQNRTKAMEETRKLKLKQRDEREKSKFSKHLQRVNEPSRNLHGTSGSTANYEIAVHDIRFRVAKNGSKLVKIPGESSNSFGAKHGFYSYGHGIDLPQIGDLNAAKATPKTAIVGGVKFHRSKNGNMFRSGVIKAQRYGLSTNYTEECENWIHQEGQRAVQGFLNNGFLFERSACRYIHDPSKVAVCKEFLLKGACPSGDSCDLSHDLTPERTPNCLHFARGNCSNPACRYTHVRVSPAALVCRAFGIYGYCENGSTCEERHVHECPDFSNTGTCNTKGCKLPHRHKASVMRTNTITTEEENSDLSSDDDDEEIDSDDVDSDDLDEEFFGEEDGKTDLDIPMQQDFVHFS